MPNPMAVYLDLTDLQSARVWRWLTAVGCAKLEVRPFVMAVDDPWTCTMPPLSLELAMLMEQARDHGHAAVRALVDAAFDHLLPAVRMAHEELAAWLAIGAEAGLPLLEYDHDMERLRAEVGLWQAEAIADHGVVRAPTLLFDDGTTVYLQLDADLAGGSEATAVLQSLHRHIGALAAPGP